MARRCVVLRSTVSLWMPERHAQLAIVIVSFNRREALLETLARVVPLAGTVVVVDNASTDDSVEQVRERCPDVQLIANPTNQGVAAFNQGVAAVDQLAHARGIAHTPDDLVLILDDDARPDPASLDAAIAALARDPNLAGVALLPIHPATNRAEWRATEPTNRFPMMGCANLIRRDCWRRVGGYCEGFFLYRNDTDLALSLLSLRDANPAGASVVSMGVAFNPAWFAHHDSPAATRKSERWLHLATRNWIWMGRRHGRGVWRLLGIALGALWACKLAGLSLSRLARVGRGVREGIFLAAPPVAGAIKPDGPTSGRAYRDLIRMQMRR